MGRFKLIETPEILWDLFTRYKKHVKENPIIVKDWVGKDAEPVDRKKEIPLTMVGFECFICDNTEISYPNIKQYIEGKDTYSDFLPISSRILAEIKSNQTNGGMTMIFSQNLTARLNGYSEKKEIDLKGSLNIPQLPDIGTRK